MLIVGHPYVDVWAAVKPQRFGLEAWPQVPRNVEWKKGICQQMGWPHRDQADIARAWKHILGGVRSFADLEPSLLGRVEELIDFVTSRLTLSVRGLPCDAQEWNDRPMSMGSDVPPPPPQPYRPGPPPMRPDDEKLWAIGAHLGPLVLGVIAPLVVWLVFRERSAFLDRTAKEALNMQLSYLIYFLVAGFSIILLIGLVLLPVVGIAWLVLMILATVKVGQLRGVPLPGDHPLPQVSRSRTTASASSRPRVVSTSRSSRSSAQSSLDLSRDGRASVVVQRVERQALAEPGLQQHPLDAARPGVERLAAVGRAEAVGHPHGVRRGVLDVPPPDAADVRVRAGADAPPVAVGPVAQVVPAGRHAPVGDLVPPQPGPLERLVGQQVLVGQVVVVGHRHLAAPDLPGQRGAVLDDQGVRRDVVGLAREGGVDRGSASRRATPPACRRSGPG